MGVAATLPELSEWTLPKITVMLGMNHSPFP